METNLSENVAAISDVDSVPKSAVFVSDMDRIFGTANDKVTGTFAGGMASGKNGAAKTSIRPFNLGQENQFCAW